MNAIEYLDEDLPEIEIKELVSVDKTYEYSKDQKKGINVLNPTDMLLQLTMLLQSKQRAKGFLKLHQEILTEELFTLPVAEVHVQRIDAGDEDVFFENLDQAKKIENYFIAQQEIHKAFLGFETTKEDPPQLQVTAPTTVLLQSEPNTQTILLPEDHLVPTIEKYHDRVGIPPTSPAFRSLKLADRITETVSFKTATPLITELQDLYGLWKEFMRYNQTLDYPTLKQLQEQLEQLNKKDKEIYTFIKQVKSYEPNHLHLEEIGGLAFYSIQRQIFLALQPVLERLQTQLLDLYSAFLQSLASHVSMPDELPLYAYDLIQELINNRRTIADTMNILKLHMLKKQQQTIQQWLQEVSKWNSEEIEKKVEENYQRYLKTTASIQDEPFTRWSSVNEHIKEVIKGEIISKTVEEAFLPALSEKEMVLEKDDPDEITLPIFEEPTELNLPVDHLNEGQKELFTITYRMLYNLHKASGLPLDLQKLALNVPSIYRKTKLANIQEQLPQLPTELQIIASRLDEFSIIEVPTVKITLQHIHQQFLKDLHDQLHYLLAWWICDLQRHVLNRTLNFEIWQGSTNCIPVWSPYGVPMEQVRKREGILPYLQCVIEDLVQLEGTSWYTYYTAGSDLLEKLQSYFEKEFASQIEELQKDFKTFDKDLALKNLKSKGLAVKEDIETVVKNRDKTKYLQEYMRFLKNLPSVLIQSSIAKRIYSGCCLQLLSDKYASDYDWSAYVKDAYKLKKLFATQKLEKEPHLAQYRKVVPEEIKPSTIVSNASYLETPPIDSWSMDDWTEVLKKYMPTSSLQNLPTHTEKNISIYARSIKNTIISPFINNSNLQTLIELYRRILHVQYLQITQTETETEKAFLLKEFSQLEELNTLLLSSQDYFNDVQELFRKRVLQFFISRQLCFPAKPEFARNNTLVLIEADVERTLLDRFLQETFDQIQPWITEKQFNQTTNFQEYIAKMREQETNAKLQIIDKMNPEERKLYVEAKKLGISELQEYLSQFKREPEQEGEEYVNLGENNDEMDMDNLYDDEV